MTSSIYLQINLICYIVILLILLHSRKYLNNNLNNKIFSVFILITMVIIVVDSLCWCLNGESGKVIGVLIFYLNIIFYILQVLIVYGWLLFCLTYLYGDEFVNRKNIILTSIPAIIWLFIVILVPNVVFTINDNNEYVRGSAYFIQYIFSLGYILITSLIAFLEIPKTNNIENRKDYLFLGLFCFLPLCASIVQGIFYGITIILPMIIASVFMVYINIQHNNINIDGVTGLANRGYFDNYLKLKFSKENKKYWFLIMADIDNLKKINDEYGHIIGDEAIKVVANVLKKSFKQYDSVIARYGGDEFAIIYNPKIGKGVKKVLVELNKNLEIENSKFNKEIKSQLKISISVGYSEWVRGKYEKEKELIDEADQKMYEVKIKKKAEKDQNV